MYLAVNVRTAVGACAACTHELYLKRTLEIPGVEIAFLDQGTEAHPRARALATASPQSNSEARSPASQRSSVHDRLRTEGSHALPVAVTSITEGREPNG